MNVLTSSRREYYIFSGPPCGIIFSENLKKTILAIKKLFVNETKSSTVLYLNTKYVLIPFLIDI